MSISGSIRFLAELTATFFYIGKSPKMPGTVGSVAGVLLSLFFIPNHIVYGIFLVFMLLLSFWSSISYAGRVQKHDPKEVVIDEVVGQLLSIYLMITACDMRVVDNVVLIFIIINFIFFRIFDILKPFPISYIDKKLYTLSSIVLDDLVAGIFSGVITIVAKIIF